MKPGFDYIGITTPFYCHDGQGNFLLHKRSQNCRDEQGAWDCGGGRLLFGEDPIDGVLREVKEEYGCEGDIQEHLPYYSLVRLHQGQKTHWVAFPFIIKVNRQKVINNEPDKILEIGWFNLNKLPQPLHSGTKFGLSEYSQELKNYIK